MIWEGLDRDYLQDRMQYKGNFHDGSTEEGNALLKSFDLFSALSIKKKYVFIQLYMQIH